MTHVEREVKLTIAKQDFSKFLSIACDLGTPLLAVQQENTYIGVLPQPEGYPKTSLRLRKVLEGQNTRYFYTFKAPHTLKDGVSECEETEGALTEQQFEQFILKPTRLVEHVNSHHPGVLPEEFLLAAAPVPGTDSAGEPCRENHTSHTISIIAVLKNTRSVVRWENWTLEVDHCQAVFPCPGEMCEVEVETQDHEFAKYELCRFMDEHGVRYRESEFTKLAFALGARLDGEEF